MKAIETSYRGYRFRSRLEARWAVFFDSLRVNWEFEPEGFDVGGGARYLPDFRVMAGLFPPLYVEVKPSGLPLDATEVDRYWRFSTQLCASEKDVGFLVVRGDPINEDGFLFGAFGGEPKLGQQSPLVLFAMAVGGATSRVADAAIAARAARFEHGETGRLS